MDLLYTLTATFVLLNFVLSGIRIAIGPTKVDRMMAGQLLSTCSVAILLLLAESLNQPNLRTLAIVFVGLAALTSVAFIKHFDQKTSEDDR